MSERDDRYLFDGSGPPDPDVERLERVLRPLGTTDDAVVTPVRHPPARWVSPAAIRWTLAAMAVAAAIWGVAVFVDSRPTVYRFRPEDRAARIAAAAPVVRAAGAADPLAVGSWIETAEDSREITIGDTIGRITLGARSRLQVRHVADETTRLYLARGALEAFVSADARPRFFQVDTDAARCVDLGCRYTLEVADDGVATVRVTTGQVAFETGTREVYVPSGATCAARPGAGPGTPRFEDAPDDLRAAFDALDGAARAPGDERSKLARAALATVRSPRDALAAWHLLQEPDAGLVRDVVARLEAVAGPCAAPSDAGAVALREAWKAHLEPRW